MPYVFDLPARPAVPIAGSHSIFPVRRIFCIGRNYAAHAREMGKDPTREPPFFFTKFPDTVVPLGGLVPYPSETANYHFEAELVIAIGEAGAALSDAATALDLVFGYAVGLDMTRRDLQLEARDKGRPWDTGKNFAFSAPIGPIRPAGLGHISSGRIQLAVNGVIKQDGDIGDLIWNCAETITYLSRFDRLLPGDLIYTGTPAGVGPVNTGDFLQATIEGLDPLSITIGQLDPAFKA